MIDLPCWSEQLRRWCTSEAYISELWLFGSFAKGCATPDSDIDLACVMAGAERLANWIFESDRMKAEIEALIPGKKISLNHFDPHRSTGIVADAVREYGRLLYKRA